MKIRFLGCHQTETATAHLSSLMVNQDLIIDAGAITSTLTAHEQSQIKALLLTHRHLDHTRDVPTLALGGFGSGDTLPVFATEETLKSVSRHLLNGSVYPDFTQIPSLEQPRIRLVPLVPGKEREVCGHRVVPVPVVHTEGSVGYFLKSPDGESFFYSGDTNGEGLAGTWLKMRPDLVIVEVTYPNSQEHLARLTNHMTPQRLGREIAELKQSGGKIPQFFATHFNTQLEREVKEELRLLSTRVEVPITPAHEELVVIV